MPTRITADEMDLLRRVRDYCADGLTGEQMAAREGITLSGLRARLQRVGVEIEMTTSRRLVKLRSDQEVDEKVLALEFEVAREELAQAEKAAQLMGTAR